MSDNYLIIGDIKIPISEFQKNKILAVAKTTPFDRVPKNQYYYIIDTSQNVYKMREMNLCCDEDFYNEGNYCADETLLHQWALHEKLNRQLWRYSIIHNDLETNNSFYVIIRYDSAIKGFVTSIETQNCKTMGVRFTSEDIAKNAINDIVVPFVKIHPEFVW